MAQPTRPRRPARAARRRRLAPLPDRHVLYERAVQNAGWEVEVLERILRSTGGARRRLREDFGGTALLSATWVERGPDREAVAVDLDPAVLAWARAHRLPDMGPAAARLRLAEADVRRGPRGPFDVVAAMNFSWQVFRTRPELRGYFAAARRGLAPGGVLVLDAFGGWEAQQEVVERRKIGGGITYVWEHERYDPITARLHAAIHFEASGGRRIRRAFRYDWRLWTLPEVRELLAEAGFRQVDVWWDVARDPRTSRYRVRGSAENTPGWIAYVAARR